MLAPVRRQRHESCALACIAIACLVAYGAGASDVPNAGRASVSANAAIIARVGDDFFRLNITPQSAHWYPPEESFIARPNGYFLVSYRLQIPQFPFVDTVIECIVDSDGRVSNLTGAPDCIHEPHRCIFPVDQVAAGVIAEKAGLELGTEAWRFHFHWNQKYQAYVWTVSTTLARHKSSGEGRVIVIDANDGRLLEILNWFEMS